MISNISETKKMTFPPNIENLTILLMDQPDSNRLELQNKIQKVLDTLIAKNIISEENNIYHFYKEDEIDVAAAKGDPHNAANMDDDDEIEDDSLDEAWSCPTAPPKLW